MMLRLTEIFRKVMFEGKQRVVWETRDVYINKDSVVVLKPNNSLKRIFSESSSSPVSSADASFTTIFLKENKEIVVLGSVVEVQQAINGKKEVLHG